MKIMNLTAINFVQHCNQIEMIKNMMRLKDLKFILIKILIFNIYQIKVIHISFRFIIRENNMWSII